MQLERCLVKDLNTSNPGWQTVAGYEKVYLTADSADKWIKTLSDLPKYDDDGNAYYYSANETGFLVQDGATLPDGLTAQMITVDGESKRHVTVTAVNTALGWGQSYSRTDAKTTVSNHDGEGSGHFAITKSWKDNNDIANRPPVTIRIYDREKLHTAVSSQTGAVDWTTLNNVPYAEQKLNSGNNYTFEINFKDLCNGNENLAKTKTIADYVVLEYRLGDNTQTTQTPVSYTYQDLAALSGNGTDVVSAIGTVNYDAVDDTKDRSYTVTNTRNPSRNTFYLLNERVGTTELALTKTWRDENNAAGLRPNSISFQLYRDGALYTDLDSVSFGTDGASEDLTVTPEKDAGGSFTGTFTATYSGDTGGNTAEQWTITVKNLPMFADDTGMLYAYNIDERNATGTTAASGEAYYIQSRGLVETTQTGSTQHFTIPLTNTVAGTTSHTAYKYWRDISAPKELRPELIYTLYRYRKSDYKALRESNHDLPALPTYDDLTRLSAEQIGFEKVTGHDDPVLTAGDGITQSPSGQAYDWLVTISDLRRFDSEGREYAYVLREQMTNNGVTVRGTYTGETVRRASGNTEYDEFTNTIHANLTLSGVKTWKGHEKYTLTMADLPVPTITLYRTTDRDLSGLSDLNQISEEEFNQALTDLKIVKVDEIQLTEENKTFYSFPSAAKKAEAQTNGQAPEYMVLDGENLMLPQYDEFGRRYTYLMYETLPNDISDALYAKKAATGTLVNTLNPDTARRTIRFHKTWKDWPTGNDSDYHSNVEQFPSVTFELYRYLDKNGVETAHLYKSKTISAAQLKKAYEEEAAKHVESGYNVNDFEYEDEFTDLLIYSLKGDTYGYYVKEKPINGYTTVLTYRCLEVKVGSAKVKYETSPIGTEVEYDTEGTYKVVYSKIGDRTIVQNELDSTELKVKKEWDTTP